MDRICKTVNIAGQHDVELIQTHFNTFTVTYGKQVKAFLSYEEAATELGSCIMHALACAGELDNRTSQEAKKDGDRKPVYNR